MSVDWKDEFLRVPVVFVEPGSLEPVSDMASQQREGDVTSHVCLHKSNEDGGSG